jgi:hypothetical protein
MKKKEMSVYGEHHDAVFPIGFTLRIVTGHGVTVFIAAADGEPSAVVMIIGFLVPVRLLYDSHSSASQLHRTL